MLRDMLPRSGVRLVSWSSVIGFLFIAGCTVNKPKSIEPKSPPPFLATIQEIMDAEVDPSADDLWDAVVYISDLKGSEQRQPRTDEEWATIRLRAICLIEAANLLIMDGRRVSTSTAPGAPGDLPPEEIQRHLDHTRLQFAQFANALKAAATQALTAIDSKDPAALTVAGGVIDQTCEVCHVTYWYPRQH